MINLTPQLHSMTIPLLKQLQQGISFDKAMQGNNFDELIIEQVTIAIYHSDLATCLNQIALFLKMRLRYRQRLQQLLIYPLVLLCLLFLLIIGLRCSVISELQDVIQQTIMPIDILLLVLLGIILIEILLSKCFVTYLKRQTRLQQADILCHLPIIGVIWRNYYHYMLIFDLAILVKNGLSFTQICQAINKQRYGSVLSDLVMQVRLHLHNGNDLVSFIEHTVLLPQELVLFINQGCSYQELGIALQFLAETQFRNLQQRLMKMLVWLQPLMFLLIALIIVAVYLSVLLPVYQMMEGF